MSVLNLTRRQFAVGAISVSGLRLSPAFEPVRMYFPKGAPLPPWLEFSTKPACFGVAVEVVEKQISVSERANFLRAGYRDVLETQLMNPAAVRVQVDPRRPRRKTYVDLGRSS